ncbi:MAG TPA: hypothetical protein VM029_18955 [Opitutaceae bacterium]|nr:hypothetical protein [Opitutaceae bacterium]
MPAAVACAGAEPWVKVTTDHFTILTPAGEPVAKKWAVELEQFRRGLQRIVPVGVERLRPVTVVLFINDKSMEPYVPLEKGTPAKLGGLFVRANDINTIMLSLARDARETRHVIFHEAVHWQLSAFDSVMPLWLGEGLAELYATFEMTDENAYAFGAAMPSHVRQLRGGKILPLPQLLAIDRSSLLYNEGARTGIFYAQSWAFVHFLLYGEDAPGQPRLMYYLELLRNPATRESAFITAFGAEPAELEKRLRSYIMGGTYLKHHYARRSTDKIERMLKVGPATEADLELAKGSLLFGTRTAEAAEPYMWRAAQLAPEDPRAWEMLGHVALARKDFPAAFSALGRAAAAGSTSYLVYHNLAVSRLPEPTFAGRLAPPLDPREMDAAAEDYRQAIRLAPTHLPSYEGLAGLVYGMQTVDAGDADILQRGLQQSAQNTMIEVGIAAVEIRSGRAADGRARLEWLCARNAGRTDPGTQFARRILADEKLKAELDEIEWLVKEKRFVEGIRIADRALERPLEPAHRQLLAGLRRRIADFNQIKEAVTLANRGQDSAATQMLETLVLSGPDHAVKVEAQRILREIAGRQPGL